MKLNNVGLTGSWISSEKDISRSIKYLHSAFVVYAIEFHLVWNIIVGLNYPRKFYTQKVFMI